MTTSTYADLWATATSLRWFRGRWLSSRVDAWMRRPDGWFLPRTGHCLSGTRPPSHVLLTRHHAMRLPPAVRRAVT